MITDINTEDRLVRRTFAAHLEKLLGWNSVYAAPADERERYAHLVTK